MLSGTYVIRMTFFQQLRRILRHKSSWGDRCAVLIRLLGTRLQVGCGHQEHCILLEPQSDSFAFSLVALPDGYPAREDVYR